jgi:hypothetical protein
LGESIFSKQVQRSGNALLICLPHSADGILKGFPCNKTRSGFPKEFQFHCMSLKAFLFGEEEE